MKKLVAGALIVAGLINFFPLIGVISAAQLEGMYGVPLDNGDLVILMRHRAILFGVLGAFIIYSAFRESLQTLACIAGLISMTTFVALAHGAGEYGEAFDKVIIADYIGTVALITVLILRARIRNLPGTSS